MFFRTQKFLPIMNDGGKIVNLSTGLTRIIMANRAAYGSIKGAVEVLTKYMAKELGPRGIAVNVVAPGAIATDFSGGVVRDNPEVNKAVFAMTALGRAGVPDTSGPMIASLLSEDNRWISAQRIEVSGDMSIGCVLTSPKAVRKVGHAGPRADRAIMALPSLHPFTRKSWAPEHELRSLWSVSRPSRNIMSVPCMTYWPSRVHPCSRKSWHVPWLATKL